MVVPSLPALNNLPASLPIEGAVSIALEEGVPIFRASKTIQDRIQELLNKHQETALDEAEEAELDRYEEIDDYLSFVNRTVRNLILESSSQDS